MSAQRLSGTAWLRELKSDPDPATVLVCFPPGGGSATAYRALAQRFGSGTAVFGVQYPGRQDRLGDAPVPVLTELAALAAADLLAWPKAVRLAIFGHSMGATVAYEAAHRIEADGRELSHLFVSGRPAPAFEETARLHAGPDEGLIADLERLSNDPASVRILREEPGLAELVLPAVRNDYRAVETYRYAPGAPLRAPITALISSADPTTSVAQAGQWRDYTAADFDLATFEGGHFYLDLPENLSAIAGLITSTLAGTLPDRSNGAVDLPR
ncbi:thioesterase II family protein [Nocardia aurantiaca]|uniref:Thioesterase TesA n=1 Tax=Nocardia aurantiaca TaxID=2675850 RepID=A0A6I3L964_9NOCA|nr:alpha/beta fold hydrolase [Nocardia aurantiaca]MTE16399.1 alpha/beta fold hydrolase [Nocardia aurantiaca]